jgi:hypothetical protein
VACIAGLTTALLVGAGGVDHEALGGVVALLDGGGAGELELHRAHADGDLAVVLVVAQVVGELGAGQARGDLRDVVEEPPDLVDGLRDLEAALDQHVIP